MLENLIRSLLGLPRKPSLEERVAGLEIAVVRLCDIVVEHVNRIDKNTKVLESGLNEVAQAVVQSTRPYPGQSNN
jgi:uncharacterized coiled-coil protein SlyX